MNLRRLFGYTQPLDAALRHNYLHLFFDIGWWGVYVGTTVAFLSIYAARCGATREQLGLLSALPALVSLVFSLPSGLLTRSLGAHRATALGALLGRAPLILYALLPWLFPASLQVHAILITAGLLAIPQTLVGVSFGQFLMESVPILYRGEVVSMRMAIMSVASFVTTILAGQLMTRLPFPQGYQIVFMAGALAAAMTAFHVWRTQPIADPHERSERFQPQASAQSDLSRARLRIDAPGKVYLRVVGLLFLFNFTNSMFAPVMPDLLVNHLRFSDAIISLGTALSNILMFIISLFISHLIRRSGNRRATGYGAILLCLHAVTLAFMRGSLLYFTATLIGGVASGILATAQYNYNLDHVPQRDRSTWLGFNMLVSNAAVLLGALAGPALVGWFDFQNTFLIFGGLRLLIGLAIVLWGEPRRSPQAVLS